MTSESPPAAAGMNRTLRENIESLARRRQEDIAKSSLSERISDRITGFAGSMTFVAIHVLLYGSWIAVNAGWIPGLPRFDPSLVLLAMAASVEAIFLSTFVLISQNRMMEAADRRADLDLHISLLAEHELTRLARLSARIAEKLEVPVDDPDFEEVTHNVEPTAVLDELERLQANEDVTLAP
jgi:uncharacterized membrane protein